MRFFRVCFILLFPIVTNAGEAPVEMPEVSVQSARPGKFSARGIVNPDGSTRLLVYVASSASRDGTFLYGDFRPGDEIVRVDGMDITSLKKGDASAYIRAGATVTVRRRVALKKYDFVDVECKRAEPPKKMPNQTPEPTAAAGRGSS